MWITPGPRFPVITSPTQLQGLIAGAAGVSAADVATAMNHAVDAQGAPAHRQPLALMLERALRPRLPEQT